MRPKQIQIARIRMRWIREGGAIWKIGKTVLQRGLLLLIDQRQQAVVLLGFLYFAVALYHPQKGSDGQERPTQGKTPMLLRQKNDEPDGQNEKQQSPYGE